MTPLGSEFGDIKFQWTGLEAFLKKIEDRPKALGKVLPGVLMEEGEELIAEAKPIVPVEHGLLRASGHVNLPEISGDKVSVVCGFGGVAGTGNVGGETNEEDVGYGVIVHEDVSKHHTVGQAKFLEIPFNRRKDGMADRIAERIDARLK